MRKSKNERKERKKRTEKQVGTKKKRKGAITYLFFIDALTSHLKNLKIFTPRLTD